MSGRVWKCGHPRTPENTAPGVCKCCNICLREAGREAQRRKQAATRQRNRDIVKLYEAGTAIPTLARHYNLGVPSINAILRQGGHYSRAVFDGKDYPERAIRVAAQLAGANVEQLCSRWKAPYELLWARFAVMAALRKRNYSYPKIGAYLGGRDHSTAVHGVRRAGELMMQSPEFEAMFRRVDLA